MPLTSGSSNDVIGENIARLMSEGKSQDQAVAIALSQSGRSNKSARFRRAFDSFIKKGGAGSGNFGHSGRMGEIGGSGGGGGAHESNPSFSERQSNAKAQAAYFRSSAGQAAQTAMNYFDGAPRGRGALGGHSGYTPERRLVAHMNLDHRHFVEGTGSKPRVDSHAENLKGHQAAHDSGPAGHTHPGDKVNAQYPHSTYQETDAQSLARALRIINGKTGIADVLKDFSVGDGLQDYNLGPGQKKPKTRKKGRTAKTVFEQFPRDYVVRDKTGIADALKYTADQVRDKGKFIPGSADVRHRNGSFRRGVLPGMHYHGNQSLSHQGGDTSHGHKPGAV
jgi:hypothetical protein